MGKERSPIIGRPFGNSITENQLRDLFQTAANFRSIQVKWPIRLSNTATGGLRMHIDPKVFRSTGGQSAPTVLGRAIVVGNDQVDPALTDESEMLAVRAITDKSPYDGTVVVGEIEQVRTWWPKRNSDYASVRYTATLATGGELPITTAVTPVLLVDFGEVAAFLAEAGGPVVRQYKITDVSQSDYLTCREMFGETVGTVDVYVAKPWFLRGSNSWNNKTRLNIRYTYPSSDHQKRTATKTVSGRSVGESQTIVPYYNIDDLIYAIGATTNVTITAEPSPIPVTLLDINTDGRMWAS